MLAASQPVFCNDNAPPACLRQEENPNRLVSLWDIVNEFNAYDICLRVGNLSTFEAIFSDAKITGRPYDLKQCGAFLSQIAYASRACEGMGLIDEVQQFNRIQEHLFPADDANTLPPDASALAVEAKHTREILTYGMQKLKFVYIEPGKIPFVNNEALLGGGVRNFFTEAAEDIRAAGNCLAVDCSTAAVFHLMRAAEFGLRRIARKLRVRLTHSGSRQPLEFADWEKVITGVKNSISKARTIPPGPKRQARLETYSDLADNCTYMKDIWRNNVSHARKGYNSAEATGVMERVRDFMDSGRRVLEKKRTI
jgi:hypothetical protein